LGQLSLVEPINPRELEVLRLMAAGQTNSQIAEQLVISIGTVKTHVHNICGKLGTRNRTEAASRARALGLV
jgi:DNA-binding NarL/FixJ family response regulator